MVNKKKIDTAEFVARFADSKQVLMGSMPSGCACGGGDNSDTAKFKATLGSFKMDRTIEIELEVPKYLPEGVEIDERKVKGKKYKEWVLVDSDGKEWKPRLRVTESLDASGNYKVYAGQYDDGCGNVLDLLVWTDPVPPVVIFGLGAAAVCGLISLIDKWTSDCSEELATTISACVNRGGIPVFHGYVTVGFNPFEGSFGCSFQCIWDRCEYPPAGAQTLSLVPETTTTTVTRPDGTTITTTVTKSVSSSSEETSSAARKTCMNTHPDALDCIDDLNGFEYDTYEELIAAVEAISGPVNVETRLQDERGPCPGKGNHYDFYSKRNGRHQGSGFSCACCEDTLEGPKLTTKYKYNG